ncbi:MAG: hypothetical protein Q7S33_04370 [Nanoarchaeota archaeon]|nr:hypothetical protein [Nanoarchaeota archaeon]
MENNKETRKTSFGKLLKFLNKVSSGWTPPKKDFDLQMHIWEDDERVLQRYFDYQIKSREYHSYEKHKKGERYKCYGIQWADESLRDILSKKQKVDKNYPVNLEEWNFMWFHENSNIPCGIFDSPSLEQLTRSYEIVHFDEAYYIWSNLKS